MPTIAAVALSNTAREIGCSPRMSTTECRTIVSVSPMNGPNARRPDALGLTISFGIPSGSACIADGAHDRALGAAQAERGVQAPLGQQAQARRAHAREHPLDRGAARARRADRVEVVAAPPPRPRRATRPACIPYGSPRIPESMTSGRAPSARSRSRT